MSGPDSWHLFYAFYRSEAILRAFCAAYFSHTAVANTGEPKQGLTLTRDLDINPTAANLWRNRWGSHTS